MTPTPEERAREVVELICYADTELAQLIGENGIKRISQAIREAEDAAYDKAQANLLQLAIHLEHAMDSLTDAERTPSVIGGYVRDWAATPLKSPKEV